MKCCSPTAPPARLTNFRERWRLAAGQWPGPIPPAGLQPAAAVDDGAAVHGSAAGRSVRAPSSSGHDFRFGHKGAASAQWCASEARNFGFEVDIVDAVLVDGERVSQRARARRAGSGRPGARRAPAGPPVCHARPRAPRGAAGPPARIPDGQPGPCAGGERRSAASSPCACTACRAAAAAAAAARRRARARGWPAVASLGTRPTVNGVVPLLEVHLFDFAGDLYGCELEVEFVGAAARGAPLRFARGNGGANASGRGRGARSARATRLKWTVYGREPGLTLES